MKFILSLFLILGSLGTYAKKSDLPVETTLEDSDYIFAWDVSRSTTKKQVRMTVGLFKNLVLEGVAQSVNGTVGPTFPASPTENQFHILTVTVGSDEPGLYVYRNSTWNDLTTRRRSPAEVRDAIKSLQAGERLSLSDLKDVPEFEEVVDSRSSVAAVVNKYIIDKSDMKSYVGVGVPGNVFPVGISSILFSI